MPADYAIIDTFNAHGKQYEVRLSSTMSDCEIRVFHDDRPANGYCYRVSFENKFDLKVLTGQDMVKELARIAKDDVIERRYEQLLDALKSTL